MRRALFCAVVLLMGLAATPGLAAQPQFGDGLRAYNMRDFGRAYAIWRPLADNGDARSQSSLGYMYYSGYGVPQDSRQAAGWFYRAANQGEATAQFFLAVMHYNADGVAENLTLSLMWCELAMTGGQPAAYEWRGHIMESMTDAQRQEAWRLVTEWYKIHDRLPKR